MHNRYRIHKITAYITVKISLSALNTPSRPPPRLPYVGQGLSESVGGQAQALPP